MSLYLGENLISGVATPIEPTRNIGQIIQSITPLTDAGLHLLDGALIQGDGIYSDFVTYMTTLSGSHPECFTTEANWQSVVSSKGACGKFVYTAASGNTTATIRLPKITGFIEGTVDSNALGELVNAGLPNITGGTNVTLVSFYGSSGGTTGSGAFSKSGQTYTEVQPANGTNGSFFYMNFDASDSNSIYGNSTTVQPQAIKVFYYIVIATTIKTDIEVDIDEVVTDLNAKAVDIDVVHKSGSETITGYKVFTNNIDRNVDAIRGQTPSTDSYSDIRFTDNNNNWLAGLEYALHQDKSSSLGIYLSDSVSNTTNVVTGIQLGLNTDGTVYTTAQTPSVSSNSSDIATTYYINNKFQKVSALPASPDADTFYFIP